MIPHPFSQFCSKKDTLRKEKDKQKKGNNKGNEVLIAKANKKKKRKEDKTRQQQQQMIRSDRPSFRWEREDETVVPLTQ